MKRSKSLAKHILRHVIAQLLTLAVLAGIFYAVLLVIPSEKNTEPIIVQRPSVAPVLPSATQPSATQEIDPTPTPEPVDYGQFGASFPDKFTDGEVIETENSYKSKDINVSFERFETTNSTGHRAIYYIADIYVRNIDNFKTVLAKDKYGNNIKEKMSEMAVRTDSVIAINGDYYGHNNNSAYIIRNGKYYAGSQTQFDVGVLFYDGTMKCYGKGEIDGETLVQQGAYQAWMFGPKLLENGQPMKSFNQASYVTDSAHPRTAVGYYEPGHYCFVVAEGREKSSAEGFKMWELSQLMYDLGCKEAYNLDGGGTTMLFFKGQPASRQIQDRVSCSDMVYIGEVTDPETEGE